MEGLDHRTITSFKLHVLWWRGSSLSRGGRREGLAFPAVGAEKV